MFLKNTPLIFGGNLLVTILVLGLAAFSISRIRVPYHRVIYFFILMTLFIPASSYMIPNFVNLKELGSLNSYWAFWSPAGANAYFFLLIKTSSMAFIRRSSRRHASMALRSWRLPANCRAAVRPDLCNAGDFIFSTAWNDWFWPSLVMQTQDKYTLATAIYKYVINARSLDSKHKICDPVHGHGAADLRISGIPEVHYARVSLSAVKG